MMKFPWMNFLVTTLKKKKSEECQNVMRQSNTGNLKSFVVTKLNNVPTIPEISGWYP
jgi:ABC-type metal ion transport system substrate-binding protein